MSDDLSNPYNKPTADPNNPYLQPAPPELVFAPEDTNKSHGCLFYGCITAVVLAVLGLILLGVLAYVAFNWTDRMVKEYTSTTPIDIPKVSLPAEEVKALDERWKAFKEAVDKGDAAELTLTADEINSLVNKEPNIKDRVYISIKDDKISGKLSLPIDFIPLGLGKGRFFNGSATLTVSLHDGVLVVHAKDFEVNGKTPPANFMNQFSRQNLAKDIADDPKNAEMLSRFDSIEIKNNKVHLKARSKSESAEAREKSAEGDEKPAAKDGDETPKVDPETPRSKDDEPPAVDPGKPRPREGDDAPKPDNPGSKDEDAPAEKKAAP
ncbi:MAG: hypothetical protein LC745_04675 [Planctomycetia bacterium]|nr:hypothetical protein [Planctomycetia bacterium]